MRRVVIAPDSFKGSAGAADAASAIADGWRRVRPDDALTLLPQADGGEGTLDAVAASTPGAETRTTRATDPDSRPVDTRWLMLPGRTAVVELAESSGLPLMRTLDPLGATSRGLGEVLGAALDAGAHRLVIGLGGSASTDGGLGALQALGLRALDKTGAELPAGGGALRQLSRLDAHGMRHPPREVRLLTDVSHPLLGPSGASAVFGPQKGADVADIAQLEAGLARLAEFTGADPDAPGAGAAGGTAYGLMALWNAVVEPGSAAIARLTGLPDAAAEADVLILGEGRFDATSLGGKVVGHALGLAGPATRIVVIAGTIEFAPPPSGAGSPVGIALDALAGDTDAAQADARRWLCEAGALAARSF